MAKTKIKFRKGIVLRSISAPYVTNKSKGEEVSIPKELFGYYVEKGIVEPVRRQKTDKKLEENGN